MTCFRDHVLISPKDGPAVSQIGMYSRFSPGSFPSQVNRPYASSACRIQPFQAFSVHHGTRRRFRVLIPDQPTSLPISRTKSRKPPRRRSWPVSPARLPLRRESSMLITGAERGDLTVKTYGKQTIFVYNQVRASPEVIYLVGTHQVSVSCLSLRWTASPARITVAPTCPRTQADFSPRWGYQRGTGGARREEEGIEDAAIGSVQRLAFESRLMSCVQSCRPKKRSPRRKSSERRSSGSNQRRVLPPCQLNVAERVRPISHSKHSLPFAGPPPASPQWHPSPTTPSRRSTTIF